MNDQIKQHEKAYVRASDIAKFLGAIFLGNDILIKAVTSFDNISENALVFSKGKVEKKLLEDAGPVCLITPDPPGFIGNNAFIVVENPRLAFAKTLAKFFVEKKTSGIGKYSAIHPSAKIGKSVIIGNFCTIGRNVVIGDNTEILNNVVIADGVKIGAHCLIRSNSVIGEEGFGFEYDDDGTPIRIPHLGNIEIGDYVEIGNFTAIARGTINNTIIHSHVKIDNLIHIAHNVIVGRNSLIISHAQIAGSVKIGDNSWVAPSSTINDNLSIGSGAYIGIGAVVIHDVADNEKVFGNPAKRIISPK